MLAELEKICYEDVTVDEKNLMLELEEVLSNGCGDKCLGCVSVN